MSGTDDIYVLDMHSRSSYIHWCLSISINILLRFKEKILSERVQVSSQHLYETSWSRRIFPVSQVNVTFMACIRNSQVSGSRKHILARYLWRRLLLLISTDNKIITHSRIVACPASLYPICVRSLGLLDAWQADRSVYTYTALTTQKVKLRNNCQTIKQPPLIPSG